MSTVTGLGRLAPKATTGAAYWDNGFKDMSANKKLLVPADFRGLKMRIQSSKVLEAQMRALGAIPQVMAFSEVYQALATGVVDGTENPPSNEYTQKMHEVPKYLTVSNPGVIAYAVTVNKKFWAGLTADTRDPLVDTIRQAVTHTLAHIDSVRRDAARLKKKTGCCLPPIAGSPTLTCCTPEKTQRAPS